MSGDNRYPACELLETFEKTKVFIAGKEAECYNIFVYCVQLSEGKKMVNYNSLWDVMRARNLTKTELRIAANMSTSTFAKLSKDEMVSLDVLMRLCQVLQCQLSDICVIENIEEEKV